MNIIAALQSSAHSVKYRYPSGITAIQTYGEARGGYLKQDFPFVGLRRFIKDYLETPITQEMVDDGEKCCPDYDREMWQYILDEHDGYLPITITGIPEGKTCAAGDVLWTIDCCDPKCALLPVMIDMLIVSYVWFESTVAQRLRNMRKMLEAYCELTGVQRSIANYLAGGETRFGNDELSRVANAMIFNYFSGSMSHGTSEYLNQYYDTHFSGCRSRVSDHSSIIAFDTENDCLETLLERHEFDWFAVLADSKDYGIFFDDIIPEFKEKIMSRIAPISIGVDCEQHFSVIDYGINSLKRTFGVEPNHLGFNALNAPIVIAQVEDLTLDQIRYDLDILVEKKWSPINFYWHLSDRYMQDGLERDANGFIHKLCYVEFKNGKKRDVCKSIKQAPEKRTQKGVQGVENGHVYYDCGKTSFDSYKRFKERLVS